MNEQPGSNLEAMDEQEAQQFFSSLVNGQYNMDQILHEDYVMEMPQAGERVRGRENMRGFEMYRNEVENLGGYGVRDSNVRRAIHRDGLWVVETVVRFTGRDAIGGDPRYEVYIIELRDGKIWRETRYYAERWVAEVGRAEWVEPMDRP